MLVDLIEFSGRDLEEIRVVIRVGDGGQTVTFSLNVPPKSEFAEALEKVAKFADEAARARLREFADS